MLWLFAIIFCRRNGAKTGNKSLDISLFFIELLYKISITFVTMLIIIILAKFVFFYLFVFPQQYIKCI